MSYNNRSSIRPVLMIFHVSGQDFSWWSIVNLTRPIHCYGVSQGTGEVTVRVLVFTSS